MEFNSFNKILKFFIDVCKIPNRNLKCAIWLNSTNSTSDIDFIRDKIKNLIKLESTAIIYANNNTPSRIKFKNNSFIDIIFIKEHRGRRYDLSAYDRKIDYNLVESIIIPCSFGGFYPKCFSLKEE